LEPVPHTVEVLALVLVEVVIELEFAEQGVQRQAVEGIQIGPGQFTAHDAVQRGTITGTPRVGKLPPIHRQSFRPVEPFPLADNRAAIVDDGTKDVKDESLDRASSHVSSSLQLL